MMPYSYFSLPYSYAKTTVALASASTFAGYLLWKNRKKEVPDLSHLIVLITGCDSGLGYSLASHCCKQGLMVLACCLNKSSKGAIELEKKGAHLIELDLTNIDSIQNSLEKTKEFLRQNPGKEFRAVVNNAAVMCFGEFEWLTNDIISRQIQVNLTGTMQFTNSYCSLIRENKVRVINVSSHCAAACLPGLSVYGATKAGLRAWNDALRIELDKFGVHVISFSPGSFFGQTSLLAKQKEMTEQMKIKFKEENPKYLDYFNRFFEYVHSFAGDVPLQEIKNKEIYSKFDDAILAVNPKPVYGISPFNYSLYFFFFKISPISIRDKLITYFVNMPKWKE